MGGRGAIPWVAPETTADFAPVWGEGSVADFSWDLADARFPAFGEGFHTSSTAPIFTLKLI